METSVAKAQRYEGACGGWKERVAVCHEVRHGGEAYTSVFLRWSFSALNPDRCSRSLG